MTGFKRYLPILQWAPGYRPDQAASDLLAAVMVTVIMSPQALAYSVLAGLPHPVQTLVPEGGIWALAGLFLLSESLVMVTGIVGLSQTRHRGLWPVVPLLHLYHPLGAIAGWRALWEAFRNPFYWAKTSHGHFDHAAGDPAARSQEAEATPPAIVLNPSPFRPATPAVAAPQAPVIEPAASRISRTLAQDMRLADLPAQSSLPPRMRTSPASIFSRVSKAREIWVRSAS